MVNSKVEPRTNLYLRALEIGFEAGESGIFYNEIKKRLTEEGYLMPGIVFRKWVYTSFEWPNVIEYRTKVINFPEVKPQDCKSCGADFL
jgi:hypothetical protein